MEIKGPKMFCKGPSVMISPSLKRFCRKGPTSSKSLGPPMLSITTAVLGGMSEEVVVDMHCDMCR